MPRINLDDQRQTAASQGLERVVADGEAMREGILCVWDGDSAEARLEQHPEVLRRILRLGSVLLAGIPLLEIISRGTRHGQPVALWARFEPVPSRHNHIITKCPVPLAEMMGNIALEAM
ncbi:hypothetical protein MLD38_011711 [Melastoma candidum]|uniref:Uncharacterized protein n=1 Tax=Melastoma candidum TaxID=119954 RepID=A0ACB9R5P9_9MYRT|nr:hypothetical protein MLD38_011711 [Melastoma candidum]